MNEPSAARLIVTSSPETKSQTAVGGQPSLPVVEHHEAAQRLILRDLGDVGLNRLRSLRRGVQLGTAEAEIPARPRPDRWAPARVPGRVQRRVRRRRSRGRGAAAAGSAGAASHRCRVRNGGCRGGGARSDGARRWSARQCVVTRQPCRCIVDGGAVHKVGTDRPRPQVRARPPGALPARAASAPRQGTLTILRLPGSE